MQPRRREEARRYFLPTPFAPPCFTPQIFFDPNVLGIVRGLMDDRVVADQWGCDVPLRGSEYQGVHVDYQRPLFPESPDTNCRSTERNALSDRRTRRRRRHEPLGANRAYDAGGRRFVRYPETVLIK
jgi:hypothetical protein